MKRLILILSMVMLISGCYKSETGITNNSSNSKINTVVINDNGTSHIAKGEVHPTDPNANNKVTFTLTKGGFGARSSCGFYINDTSFDFKIDIDGIDGPASGIGKYHKYPTNYFNTYTQKYNGYKEWGMDSFTIVVDTIIEHSVKGNFTLWMVGSSASEKKTITGTFDCYYIY